MSMNFDEFKSKMKSDDTARANFISDVHNALTKQGVNISDPKIMKDFGFTPEKPLDAKSLESTVVITLVM